MQATGAKLQKSTHGAVQACKEGELQAGFL